MHSAPSSCFSAGDHHPDHCQKKNRCRRCPSSMSFNLECIQTFGTPDFFLFNMGDELRRCEFVFYISIFAQFTVMQLQRKFELYMLHYPLTHTVNKSFRCICKLP